MTSASATFGTSHRDFPLDPGAGARRLRIFARVRRRQLFRGQHVPDQRLVQARAARCSCEELRGAGIVLCQHARPERALHLSSARARALASDRIPGASPMPQSFSHRLMAQDPIRTKSGTVRIADSKNFPASVTIAAALVEILPGGMRELHWHPNTDEWQYYIEGQGRMGVFASAGDARTFDYQAGDVGFVPFAMGHYIENTGSTPLRFLEMFKSSYYADVSLNRWMALTPPELVQGTLKLDATVMSALRKGPAPVVPA